MSKNIFIKYVPFRSTVRESSKIVPILKTFLPISDCVFCFILTRKRSKTKDTRYEYKGTFQRHKTCHIFCGSAFFSSIFISSKLHEKYEVRSDESHKYIFIIHYEPIFDINNTVGIEKKEG